MSIKYRELNIAGKLREKKNLVREISGRNVLIRDSSNSYRLGGTIYFNDRNSEHYFLKSGKKDMHSLSYDNLVGLEVCVEFQEV